MTGKITHFKYKDFDEQGTFNQFHSEYRLDNLLFRKGDTFKHQEIQQVLNTCKKYNNFGANTLIVQGESDLTIWIEHVSPSQATPAVKNDLFETETQNVSDNSQTSLPTKKITKRYRGQIYEETVVDWAAVAIQKQPQSEDKNHRKYRGNYID